MTVRRWRGVQGKIKSKKESPDCIDYGSYNPADDLDDAGGPAHT